MAPQSPRRGGSEDRDRRLRRSLPDPHVAERQQNGQRRRLSFSVPRLRQNIGGAVWRESAEDRLRFPVSILVDPETVNFESIDFAPARGWLDTVRENWPSRESALQSDVYMTNSKLSNITNVVFTGDSNDGKSFHLNAILLLTQKDPQWYKQQKFDRRNLSVRRDRRLKKVDPKSVTVRPDERREDRKDVDPLDFVISKEEEEAESFFVPIRSTGEMRSVTPVPICVAYGDVWHACMVFRPEKWASAQVKDCLREIHGLLRQGETDIESIVDSFNLCCYQILTTAEYKEEIEERLQVYEDIDFDDIEVEFTEEAKRLFGYKVFSGNGKDSNADREFVKKEIDNSLHSLGQSPGGSPSAGQLLLEEIRCYCPCSILEDGCTITDAPGSNDADPFKQIAMKKSIENGNSIVCFLSREPQSCTSVKDLMTNHILPQLMRDDCHLTVVLNIEKDYRAGVRNRLDKAIQSGFQENSTLIASDEKMRNGQVASVRQAVFEMIRETGVSQDKMDTIQKKLSIFPCEFGLFTGLLKTPKRNNEQARKASQLITATNGHCFLGALQLGVFADKSNALDRALQTISDFEEVEEEISSSEAPESRREYLRPSDEMIRAVTAFYDKVNRNKKKPNHPENLFQKWNEELEGSYDGLQDLGKTKVSDVFQEIVTSFNEAHRDAICQVQMKLNRRYASRLSDYVSLFKLKMTDKLISRVGMGVFDPVADALANGLASLFKKNIEQHYCREEYRHLEPHLDAFIGRLRSNLVKMIKKRLTDASPGHRKWGVACVRELIDKAEKKLVNGRRFKVDEQAPFAETCANYAANLESIIERRVESKLMSMKKRLWRERKYEVALDIEALLSRPTQIVVELALKNTQAHFPSIIEAFVGYLKFAKSRQEGTAAVDLFPPAISVIDEAKTKLRSLHDSIKKLQDAGNVATAQFLGMRLMTPDNSFVDDEEDEAEF